MKTKVFNYLLYSLLILFSIANTTSAQELTIPQNKEQSKTHQIAIKTLPDDVPNKMIVPINYAGETLSMVLEKTSVFGKNTRCLIDDGTGKLIEVPMNVERNYIGTIAENKEYSVNAVLTDRGIIANIYRPNQSSIEITPSQANNKMHQIREVVETYDCTAPKEDTHESSKGSSTHSQSSSDMQPQPSIAPVFSSTYTPEEIATPYFAATLRPTTVMEVREFEIGVEIGSRSFFSTTAYNGNLSTAQASAQSIVGNLNSRFLSAAGVRFRLGTVIIRTNASTDPLRNLVTATGGATNGTSSLRAFGDYWNNNPNEVGNTHDIAVYHVAARPSGLAWLNGVTNTRNRYATMGGNGATSWANGTAAHEVGHSFGLRHVNDSGFFYEAKPRNNSGSNSTGGDEFFVSIMDGRGRHNIGRMAFQEARTVTNTKNSKRSFAERIANPQSTNPFGVYDEVEINPSQSSILIDVIANDYDINNDVLDVRLLDRTSFLGGRISLSQGTGPGGRNQLQYTPPSSGISNRDFFHYTVFDTSGKTDFGAVYVSQGVGYDRNSNEATFDFGTSTSPVFNDAIRVTNTTNNNDYRWTNTSQLRSADRGGASGDNALNRDFIFSSQPRTFEVNLRNGVWQALITFGDRNFAHDRMVVKAQGDPRARVNNLNTNAGQFLNRRFDVEVRNGKLAIEFSDNGGSDINWTVNRLKITRLRNLPSTPNTNTAPIGSVISLRGNNGKYVSSENGNAPMNCNRDQVFAWERFTVVDAGEGKIALKGNNGRYVSSENGTKPINCNRNRIGMWEKFTWGINNGKVTLRGNNNQYISSEDGREPMNCNRPNIGRFERFDVNIISTRSFDDVIKNTETSIYPNPATSIITVDNISEGSIITLVDSLGRTITTTVAQSTTQEIDLAGLTTGIYFIKVNNQKALPVLKQ